jgi:hypothetical protein
MIDLGVFAVSKNRNYCITFRSLPNPPFKPGEHVCNISGGIKG